MRGHRWDRLLAQLVLAWDLGEKVKAIDSPGDRALMAQEECAELIVALSHRRRERTSGEREVTEEIADVLIVLLLMLNSGAADPAAVAEVMKKKIERLRDRLDGVPPW
jgi:NTP pyrophosphatase (non-canonical NTP hydrolase)